MSVSLTLDSTGQAVPIDSYPKSYTYNGPSGAMDTITASDPISGKKWVQTLTYAGSNVATQSMWVPQ